MEADLLMNQKCDHHRQKMCSTAPNTHFVGDVVSDISGESIFDE
jgi:hypothetical protein